MNDKIVLYKNNSIIKEICIEKGHLLGRKIISYVETVHVEDVWMQICDKNMGLVIKTRNDEKLFIRDAMIKIKRNKRAENYNAILQFIYKDTNEKEQIVKVRSSRLIYEALIRTLRDDYLKGNETDILEVKLREYSDPFRVELFNLVDMKPDCKIGHFGYNIYYRPAWACKNNPVLPKSLTGLIRSIKIALNKYGQKLDAIIYNKGSYKYWLDDSKKKLIKITLY